MEMHFNFSFNLAKIDLVGIRLIVLCADYGSLSKAATHAHMSVSGASHRLQALEDALGCRIFERHWRGLAMTASGREAVETARKILLLLRELEETAHLDTCVKRGGISRLGNNRVDHGLFPSPQT